MKRETHSFLDYFIFTITHGVSFEVENEQNPSRRIQTEPKESHMKR